MGSALVSGSSLLVLSLEHCVGQDTLLSQCLFPPRCLNFNAGREGGGGGEPVMN